MKKKTPLYKSELLETLPDGTLRYRVVKARPWIETTSETPKVHKPPHRGSKRSHFKSNSNRIEQYLSEKGRAQTTREIAEGLGITTSSVHAILQLMEVFGTVEKVKRGGRYRYFLKGVYDEASRVD